MRWKTSYDTGIPIIDAQHREMFELIAFPDLTSHSEMFRLLSLLIEHHSTEETLMQLYAYDQLDTHKREHGRIVGALKHSIRKRLPFPVEDILVQHFEEDKRSLAPYLLQTASELKKMVG
jgi:hemerythrin-like metal-binding protein